MGRSQQQKKAQERAAIEVFRKRYEGFPPGNILDGEEPDFVVGTSGIGIEVREYFREEFINGSPVQEQESLRLQITQRATERCAALTPKVFATVFFDQSQRLSKRDVAPVADAIVGAIREASSGPEWWLKITNDGQLPASLESLIIYVPQDLQDACVTTTDVVWVREIGEREMQNILEAKEKRLASYRRRCSEVWLLIVVNGFRIASMAQLPATFPQLVSSFDRVFVIHDGRTVVELAVAG
jgi:hypothetical protein